jgi:putative transposase
VYGSPRVHAQLQREGEKVSRTRVERLMRENGLAGLSPRRKTRTTVPNPADPRPADLVRRRFTADGPNRLWVTDLTVIPTAEGPLWLASIRDAFSRRVVAWETSRHPDANLVCAALEYALHSRRPAADRTLVHHADHGSQYTSIRLTTRLLKAGIRASMGTVGDSYDNALAENLWSTIKTECVRGRVFATRGQAETELFRYLDGFYNTTRIQKGLGWRSPDEFEAAHTAGELTEADYTRLAELAARRRARRERNRPVELASVARRAGPAGGAGPDTAAAPDAAAGTLPHSRSHTAERVRPTGRTPTPTQQNRSSG